MNLHKLEYVSAVRSNDGNILPLDSDPATYFKLDVDAMHFASIFCEIKHRGVFESLDGEGPFRNSFKLPLLTWPFLDFFENHDWKKWNLIEFGSGNSTLWFNDRVAKITSFETNFEWYQKISKENNNLDFRFVSAKELESGNYFLENNNSFPQMALIDCACSRKKVLQSLLNKTRPSIIILDNAEWYPNTKAVLNNLKYIEIPFWGFKCSEHWISCTSVFFDSTLTDLKLVKKNGFQPSPLCRKLPEHEWDM